MRIPIPYASVGSEYSSVKSNDVQSNVVKHKIVLRVSLPSNNLMMLYMYIVHKVLTLYIVYFYRKDIPTAFSPLGWEGGALPTQRKKEKKDL